MTSKPTVQFNVRLNPEVHAALEKRANRTAETRADIVDIALRRELGMKLTPVRKEPAK